ncbi:hypothetical protein [Pantoea agglomerans]|uniref:hypothetical protein n=1 Tax=Enterobacter agglomerans TaxID=549 RepID=UPI00315A8CFC
MNRETDRLSDVLTEMSAKALVTWMTHSALQDIPREVLLVRGNDFVYALQANFVLLRDVLSETMEDIEQQSHSLEERVDDLKRRLRVLQAEVNSD